MHERTRPPRSPRPSHRPCEIQGDPHEGDRGTVRLTPGERDQLADTARDLGISISTYIRQVVLSRPLPPRRAVRPIPEVNRETYHALGRVGGLLNQVAHRLHERRAEDGASDLLEVLQSVAQLLAAVRVDVLGVGGGE